MIAFLNRHRGQLALIPLAAALIACGIWFFIAPPVIADPTAPVTIDGTILHKTTIHRPISTETNGQKTQHMHESYLVTLALPSGKPDAPHRMEQQVNIAAFHTLRAHEPVSITLDPVSLRILDIEPGAKPDPRVPGRLMALGLLLLGLTASFVVWLRIVHTPPPA